MRPSPTFLFAYNSLWTRDIFFSATVLCELWIFYFLTWRKKVLRTGEYRNIKDFPFYWNENYKMCKNHIK